MKYLYKKDGLIFAECMECKKILKFKEYQLSDVKTGVECFCGNISNKIDGLSKVQEESILVQKPMQTQLDISRQSVQSFGPRCPTCGSTNVKKISLTSKAVGGAMFGLFSSDIRNTFKCDKCGYKW